MGKEGTLRHMCVETRNKHTHEYTYIHTYIHTHIHTCGPFRAVGDAIEVKNPILEDEWMVALAGPANRYTSIHVYTICVYVYVYIYIYACTHM